MLARLSEFLGVQTNNYAEYSGLLAVLKWAYEHGHRRLQGGFRLRADGQADEGPVQGGLAGAAAAMGGGPRLSRQFDGFEIAHTLRGGNKEADRLANEAMDKGMGKMPGNSRCERS